MLPASGMEAKSESPPAQRRLPQAPGRLRRARNDDTDGIDAIRGHNDGSMGKFSYSG